MSQLNWALAVSDPPLLDHAQLARLIPHAGSMCLLQAVLQYTDHRIVCRANSHTERQHPLRVDDRLGAVVAVEYAAQAMAVHSALRQQADQANPMTEVRPGYIGAIRALHLWVTRLDDLAGDLLIFAEHQAGDAAHALYAFEVKHQAAAAAPLNLIAEGRISVALAVAA